MIKFTLKLLLDYIYIFLYLKAPKINSNKTLFVRLDGIGDSMIWANLILSFNLKNNNDFNILVTRQEYHEFYSNLNIFNKIIALNHQKFKTSFSYRISIFKLINSNNINIAINPVYSNIVESFNDSIIYSTKAKFKTIGPVYKSNTLFGTTIRSFKESIYNSKVIFKHDINTHEFLYGLNLFKTLGYVRQKRNKLIINTNLKKYNFNIKKYIVIAPGSSSTNKNWPIENYVTLINELTKYDFDIIVLGSAIETEICEILEKRTRIFNLCAKTSINEMCEIIGSSLLVISNDTSSIHIATLFDVPSICINWGASKGRFLPYPNDANFSIKPLIVENYKYCINCLNACVKPTKNNTAFCINNITTCNVLSKLETLLKEIL
jgi:ADP-heptose:LPS heptosyltransferase